MTTRIDELARVAAKPTRTIVGLMSGTSLDGVDAALCQISGSGTETRIELEAFQTVPFPPPVRERILAALDGSVREVCELDFLLGEIFAEAVHTVCAQAGRPLDQIDLVASHGQTIHHIDRSQGDVPSTLQVGQGAVIAERTGRIVVCDFRPRDIACGGGGAPLVAYMDHCLFARPGATVLLQNIGGVANVTVVTERAEQVQAFDTGPGNVIIDEICRELTCDEEAFDRDGAFSKLGEVDQPLLERLLAHDYLQLPPPKTTGREVFGVPMARSLIEGYDRGRLIDLLATVVHFVAHSIARAYRDFVFPLGPVDEVVVSGGGVHNLTLFGALREQLGDLPVRTFDQLDVGFSADAKEAVAFAVLANETVQGRPSNLPAATGARGPAILGKIVL